ncbi:Clr5 domain-containing protein [Podospora aff. communis PSN243]|uniref:Clr5 domain-containing protein n=1 Tax=Podospora aff. communis PSN243 TaxID=3040156 RepID=A0AAV9GLZ0_9PEZI|nr:Clr5 domain-containing protein [Podospora aff. communis PSN243]
MSLHPTTADWDVHRDTIYRVYLEEDKSLPQLMDYMNQTHKFNATKKQYETKFKQWHLTKNLSERDWKAVIEHFEHRRQRGRENSAVVLHGRRLPNAKVKKAFQRYTHESLCGRVIGASSSAPLPPMPRGITIRSPSFSPPSLPDSAPSPRSPEPEAEAAGSLVMFQIGTSCEHDANSPFHAEVLVSLIRALDCRDQALRESMLDFVSKPQEANFMLVALELLEPRFKAMIAWHEQHNGVDNGLTMHWKLALASILLLTLRTMNEEAFGAMENEAPMRNPPLPWDMWKAEILHARAWEILNQTVPYSTLVVPEDTRPNFIHLTKSGRPLHVSGSVIVTL